MIKSLSSVIIILRVIFYAAHNKSVLKTAIGQGRWKLTDFIEELSNKAKKCQDHWQPIYDEAKKDLDFQSAKEDAQWDASDANARRSSGRPVLTIDNLAQFVNQVSNDVRMNTPSIDVIPAGAGATPEVAEIYQGLIKDIEYKSGADDAYDNAVNFSIKCGLGFIRVDHDYENELSFNQELYIQRVINPFSILYDHASIEADGSDAKYCFVFEKMDKEEYESRYPKASMTSFKIDGMECEEDEILIAEYYQVEEYDVLLVMEGDESRIVQDDEIIPDGAYTRKSKARTVKRYKINGDQILEETTFPGDYIPIVPVYGEECWIDGERHLISVIRRSKGAQRMYNYLASMETELLMKAPKSPILAAEGTTEDYAEDYLNPDRAGVLRFKQTDSEGRPAPAPIIVPPVQIPMGIVNAKQQTTQDIRATMGLYDSFLGQQDNAISGVAINNRQREGNRAVFHYADNLVRSITQVGRILVSAIPQVYDTPRIVNIIGKEETNDMVGINGMYVDGQEQNYSLALGKYNVKVTTGASFSTMRQEAAEALQALIGAQPQLMSVIGDLAFKYSDFAGAQAISERIKRTIDPKILDEKQDPQMMALSAQNQQLQQGIEMLQMQIAQLDQQLQDKQAEIAIKMQAEQSDAQNDERKYQLELEKLRMEERSKMAEIQLKQQELELKAYDLGLKTDKQAMEQRNNALQQVAALTADTIEEGL